MTLFDNKLLTEEEVAAREMCECGHVRGSHRGAANCTKCRECEGFVLLDRHAKEE